jgi:hypothetical protein
MGYKATRGAKALGVDTEKVETVKQVFTIRQEWPGISLRKIAELLNGEGYTTTRGKAFTPVQVKRVLDREDLYRGLWHSMPGSVHADSMRPLSRDRRPWGPSGVEGVREDWAEVRQEFTLVWLVRRTWQWPYSGVQIWPRTSPSSSAAQQ